MICPNCNENIKSLYTNEDNIPSCPKCFEPIFFINNKSKKLKFLKHIILYSLCILFPLLPYHYAKKLKHGLIVESIVFIITIFALYELIYAIGRYDPNLEFYFIAMPSIILGAAAFTFTDSFYHLHKYLKSQTYHSNHHS